ncbi:MAG: alginate export family protein, partial [Methylobacter sp.]
MLSGSGLASAEDYYRPTKGYRVEPASDPPPYVRHLSKTQFEQFRDVEWLDVGLDFRTRYEYRENDYRFWTDASSGAAVKKFRADPDNLWLLRTRAYIGVKDILDPLRFAVEFEDARSYNGLYERNVSDVNEFELIQGYAELYFKSLLGHNRPLSIRAGRMHLELVDRRLIGNNQFRNTTNNFEGFRVRFGKQQNNWDLDTFALQPVDRLKYAFDQPDEDTWIYGGVLSLKQWSEFITIQPYFLGRKTNGDPTHRIAADRKNDMDIYAPGLRVYGLIGSSGFDFDADINKQFGRFGVTRTGVSQQLNLQHDALAYSLELGHTFDHDWKPRASLYYGFGTGDNDPNRNASSGSNE